MPEQPNPDFDALLASLDAMEAQRETLGDVVIDPVVDGIKAKLQEQITAPTEVELALHESWQAVIKTTSEHGLPAPAASEAIVEATAAVERYNALKARIGAAGTASAVKVETVVDEAPAEPVTEAPVAPVPAPNPAPAAGKAGKEKASKAPKSPKTPAAPKDSTPKDSAPKADKEVKAPTGDVATDSIVIRIGDKEIASQTAEVRATYEKILRTALAAEDRTIEITDFVRELTGGLSATELDLVRTGQIEAPAGVDIAVAKTTKDRFYRLLKTLNNAGVVDHIRGTQSSKDPKGKTTSGKIILSSDLTFSEDAERGLVVEVQRAPHNLVIDMYRHTIDNGRNRVANLENREHDGFERMAKALGTIATRTEVEHERFTRGDVVKWMEQSDGVAVTPTEAAKVSFEFKEVIDQFDGDFPLVARGIRGGAHYVWRNGSTVEIRSGFPEKENFDNPVVVRLEGDTITLHVDGQEYLFYDKEQVKKTFDGLGRDISPENSHERAIAMLEYLSLFGREDVEEADKLVQYMMLEQQTGNADESALLGWVRTHIKKMNALIGEPIVNWRNQMGILIDINRSIIIERDSDTELPGEVAAIATAPAPVGETGEPLATADTDLPQSETLAASEANADALHDFVGPRKSAQEVVASVANMNETTKANIRGLLVQNGRFEYPKNLNEAVYLLQLLNTPGVMADVRHASSRFGHSSDSTKFNDFVAEALLNCYYRTLSWGNFEDILTEVRRTNQGNDNQQIGAAFASIAAPFRSVVEDITGSRIDNEIERRQHVAYLERVETTLIMDSYVVPPSTPMQAISLLTLIRQKRSEIAAGKSQAQFDHLIAKAHEAAAAVLGRGNLLTTLRSRELTISARRGRAVQTSTGAEQELIRTDEKRYPDTPSRRGRRRR